MRKQLLEKRILKQDLHKNNLLLYFCHKLLGETYQLFIGFQFLLKVKVTCTQGDW